MWILTAWNFIKQSRTAKIILAIIALVLLLLLLLPRLIDTWGKWKATIDAINKPAKVEIITKIEYRDRIVYRDRKVVQWKIKYPDGMEITQAQSIEYDTATESAGSSTTSQAVSMPMVPNNNQVSSKTIYLSGGAGSSFDFSELYYSIGSGVFLEDWLSLGGRYITNNHFIVEIAIYF